jgi:ATP-dependent Lon protease
MSWCTRTWSSRCSSAARKSIQALDAAMKADKQILLVAQKQADVDDPRRRTSTASAPGHHPAAAEAARRHGQGAGRGRERARIDRFVGPASSTADIALVESNLRRDARDRRAVALAVSQFEQYVKLNKQGAARDADFAGRHRRAGRLADTVAAHMSLKLSEKQKVLEILRRARAPRAR